MAEVKKTGKKDSRVDTKFIREATELIVSGVTNKMVSTDKTTTVYKIPNVKGSSFGYTVRVDIRIRGEE